MLMRFKVSNHLSLKDEQELSLIASPLKEEASVLFPWTDLKILPAAIIYGANASGKSNFIDAMQFMRWFILNSFRRLGPDDDTRRRPFRLDDSSKTEVSSYEVDFVSGDIRYNYGFAVDDAIVHREWLRAYPNARPQILFERQLQEFKFSRHLKGRNTLISELTRPNSLFLSAAAQNNHETLTHIEQFFRPWKTDNLETVSAEVQAQLLGEKMDNRILSFLERAGTGIVGYRQSEVEVPTKVIEFSREFREVVERHFKSAVNVKALEKNTSKTVQFAHSGRNQTQEYFDLSDESDGTRRLLQLLARAFQSLDNGTLLVVDELDSSLHTQACAAVVELFCSPTTNTKGAQLIATTHDTNLLNSDCLRRDQVWLTEKQDDGGTKVYALTDFKTRPSDNIERGYLQGRFGAVPGSRTDRV